MTNKRASSSTPVVKSSGADKNHWTYMVKCSDGSLYTGWTTDIERRLKAHNGQIPGGAKYTAGRRPVVLAWCQSFVTKQEAQSKEYALKQLSKKEKEKLVATYASSTK